MMPDRERQLAGLITLLENAGHRMTDCPVLVPAETVLDLVGPLTRGRLYLTQGIGGREFCLRPEFTIAIAQAHIKTGAAKRLAQYGYCGPVFRKRAAGTGEFLQAGAESIGRDDRVNADADMVVLAWQACRNFGIEPHTIFGDQAVFTAVLTALDLPPVWHRRLLAAFGDKKRLDRVLDDLAAGSTDSPNRIAGLGQLEPASATAIVEEMIGASEAAMIAGRHVDDIAKRLLDKAQLTELADQMSGKAATIRAYLELDCPISEAEERIADFASTHAIDLRTEMETFHMRCAAIKSAHTFPDAIQFQASFGRPLDYYTGFIFDIFDANQDHSKRISGPVCGGGRYDDLAARLGAADPVPAVGFSLWLDRLLGEEIQ